MEERMIDEEYGRGVKIRKTKDGYVDVTDATLDSDLEEGEEITFEFPILETDEDDEDLVSLTPEEAMELRRKKEEAAAARKAEYDKTCEEGNALLEAGNFKEAEAVFEKALKLDDKATEATVGYWRAKTDDFTKPEGLVEEYSHEGVEHLEYDLGSEAVAILREKYRDVFSAKEEALNAEEIALAEKVATAQARRRKLLKSRLIKRSVVFGLVGLLVIGLAIATACFGFSNVTVSDYRYIVPTIVSAAVLVVVFIVFGLCTNKFVNGLRIYRANEKLASTEDGARLVHLREEKEIYEFLLK